MGILFRFMYVMIECHPSGVNTNSARTFRLRRPVNWSWKYGMVYTIFLVREMKWNRLDVKKWGSNSLP